MGFVKLSEKEFEKKRKTVINFLLWLRTKEIKNDGVGLGGWGKNCEEMNILEAAILAEDKEKAMQHVDILIGRWKTDLQGMTRLIDLFLAGAMDGIERFGRCEVCDLPMAYFGFVGDKHRIVCENKNCEYHGRIFYFYGNISEEKEAEIKQEYKYGAWSACRLPMVYYGLGKIGTIRTSCENKKCSQFNLIVVAPETKPNV